MPYIGHLLTAEGVKPDPEKIAAITNMEKPTDVKGVKKYFQFPVMIDFTVYDNIVRNGPYSW
jgi:hypothetical protein